ncbi:MAG: galactokinase [Planctomycetota bacterium]
MSRDEQIARARSRFDDRFGRPAVFAAAAPGRVNLIGEHTDYNQGVALPMAIDRHAVLVAAPAAGASSRLATDGRYEPDEVEVDLALPEPLPNRGWANHLVGVVAGFGSRGIDVPALDVLVSSGVPVGAGLSSSAALEVAMATLLEQATGASLEPLEKAKLCQEAEHEYAGTPCGLMDQLVIAAAKPGHALLIDFATEQYQPIPLPLEDAAVLLVDTGVRRDLASTEYAARRETCAMAARRLGLDSLREATLSMLEDEAMSDVERRRAAHVITENTRTLLAAAALGAGELDTAGDLMFASHDSLRDLYEVSCDELDTIVAAARELREQGLVHGARMTGGGFGGCVVVLCPAESWKHAAASLGGTFEGSFGRSAEPFRVEAVGGAGVVGPGF